MNREVNHFFLPPGKSEAQLKPEGYLYAAHEVTTEGNPTLGGADSETVVFECIVANYDGTVGRVTDARGRAKHSLAVLELSGFALPDWPADAAIGSVVWYQFRYAPAHANESSGFLYAGLFDDGEPVRLLSGNAGPTVGGPPPGVTLPAFDRKVIKGASKKALKRYLEALDTSGGLAAYDVGQGACHAALNSAHRPSIYIDFGGGVTANTRTFPTKFKGFCFTHAPLIVLTHWDWDHWSSALRQPQALGRTWIAPELTKPLPIQTEFAKLLADHGNLYVWTAASGRSLRTKTVYIEKCTGVTTNDSGLAVTLRPQERPGKYLLPGDASYQYIRSVTPKARFDGLSMTHHGGVHHGATYPKAKRRAAAVLSAGPTNTHGHPRFDTLEVHLKHGWNLPVSTGFAGQRPSHVYVAWGDQPRIVSAGCHGDGCSTSLHTLVPSAGTVAACNPNPPGPYLAVSAPKPKSFLTAAPAGGGP